MSDSKRTVTPEALKRIELKLNDLCDYISAIKHVVSQNDPCSMGTAIDVLASQAGATADSININELQTGGCVGNYDDWLTHKG